MKQNILFYFGCIMAISTVINALNETLFINNNFLIDSNNEHFYTVNILLEANGALTSKINIVYGCISKTTSDGEIKTLL
ncbi:unnamed protein product, partial [Rotaria sordida]